MTEKIQPQSGLTREQSREDLLSRFKSHSPGTSSMDSVTKFVGTYALMFTDLFNGAPIIKAIDVAYQHLVERSYFSDLLPGFTYSLTLMSVASAAYIGGKEVIGRAVQKASYQQSVEAFLKSEYGQN